MTQQQPRLRWFNDDERIVMEGALSQLKCVTFDTKGVMVWDNTWLPKEVLQTVLATQVRYGNILTAVKTFIRPRKDGSAEYYVIGESAADYGTSWLPISTNLTQLNESLVPLIRSSVARMQWGRSEFWATGFLLFCLLACSGCLWLLSMGETEAPWFLTLVLWSSVLMSLLFLILGVIIDPLKHRHRRRKLLAAQERLKSPPVPQPQVRREPTLPKWFPHRKLA